MSEINKKVTYEKERIAALHSYYISDTFSEIEYDNIAKLASAICGTPVSLVTFMDENFQWFKAKVGTDYVGTPREIAFCEYTMQVAEQVMVVEDMTADSRFADNPLVTQDPNIRFYAGAPITTEEGYTLGTVCVLDVIPRKLSQQQIEALQILSKQVLQLLKTRKMNVDLGLVNKALIGHNKTIKGDKMRLEKELQILAAERVHEISAKNQELTRINQELETFAYISSHDLQEPLRKIQTFSSWMKVNELDTISPKGKEYLQKIETSAYRMQRLIQDLLQYSRTTTSNLDFEETTLEEIVLPVLEDLMEEINRSNARVEVKGNGRLLVIKFQFRQLLYNLLSNSLKFARNNVAPNITISLFYEEANEIFDAPHFRLEYSDNGIGFDNQYSERIFTLFQRLSSEEKVAGTGVGLTIVRKIVNNHGGTISAFGKANEGAIFIVRLPDQELIPITPDRF